MHRAPFAAAALFVAAVVFVSPNSPAEDPPKEMPRIAMCAPLFVAPKTTSKVFIRGWKIEPATEVLCDSPHVGIKILSKGAAAIPGKQDAKQIGDQQLEIEVTVGDVNELSTVNLTVVSPDGRSKPHSLLIGSPYASVQDQEPNDGFRQAQVIQLPQTVDGLIHADGNVDVFAFDIVQPNRVTVEVNARRLGSGLDSSLTLYDSRFNIIVENDDTVAINDRAASADSALTTALLPGRYYVVLQDAHDHGGPAHPYRMTINTSPM